MSFPGVYTQVIDKSFVNGLQSRFTCGLVGVASRGPLNEAVQVRSLNDFVANFGPAIDDTFLAQAVAAITGAGGDGARVVRVGTTYTATSAVGSGSSGGYAVFTSSTNQVTVGDYVKVVQSGKATTVNARIQSISTGTLVLVSAGSEAVALADTYTSATVAKSTPSGSANSAESFLTGPTYNSVLTLAGTASGTKGNYTFTVTGDASLIAAGDVLKLVQTSRSTTREAQVQSVNTLTKVVTLIPVTNTESGRQAISLQDSYSTASIYVMATAAGQTAAQLAASTEGTWANTVGSTVGMRVTVSPGSAPDTKKIFVYLAGALVETIDNLDMDSTSDDYWLTRLEADADDYLVASALFGTEPPGNTLNPWNTTTYTASNLATFAKGANGSNVSDSDYVGTLNPSADTATGLQIFNDRETFGNLFALAVPGITGAAVIQQLALVAAGLDAIALCDVPDNINAREAIDWVNAQGAYSTRPRLDNARVAFFWNWVQALDVFNGESIYLPPTCAVLGAMVLTFDRYKPWYATAGEARGQLPNVTAVRYPRVRDDVKQAIADDSVLNPILFYRGTSIVIWGNRTSQRTESFMQQISVVNLVNYILKNVAALARKFVFDPNDDQVLAQLTQEGIGFMDTVRTERGVEGYQWVCNSTNNTAATRNAKTAIIDLAIIPIGALEVIKLNLTVNESGATLNAVNNGLTS